jgi:hypothetical protein
MLADDVCRVKSSYLICESQPYRVSPDLSAIERREAAERSRKARKSRSTPQWRRTPTRRGWDQAKMTSRGRGRRSSRLVPGNGGAPALAVARRHVPQCPAGPARRARRHARTHSRDAANLQPDLQVSTVRAHWAWRRSPRQCSCHDIGAGSLPRGRERTGTGA